MTESIDQRRERLVRDGAAAAAEWDGGEGSEPVRARATSSTSQVYSIRIAAEHLDRLRSLADQRGVGASVLMRRWVLERLEEEVREVSPVEARLTHLLEEARVVGRQLAEQQTPTAGTALPAQVPTPARAGVRLGPVRRLRASWEGPDAAGSSARQGVTDPRTGS